MFAHTQCQGLHFAPNLCSVSKISLVAPFRTGHNLHPGADPGFGQGGAPASEAESCRRSEAESRKRSEHSVAGVQGLLKGPGSFWVFDAQICIFTHSRDSFSLIFDIYFDTKS